MESRELDIAYCAGVFDSEGCISVTPYPASQRRHGRHHNAIYLGMQNLATLHLFQRTVGTGTISRRKDCYCYLATGPKAAHVIRILCPYLVCKREQADLYLEFAKTFSPHVKPTPIAVIQRRNDLANCIKALMKRDAQAFHLNRVNSVNLSDGDNTEPSSGNGESLPEKVYRLEGEEPTNNPSTSALAERQEIVGACR